MKNIYRDFGSPGAGDATAEREQEIIAAAQEREAWLNELADVLNRPIGSNVNLSREEKIAEYQFLLDNPDQAVAQLQQRAGVVGEDRAEFEFLQYTDRMEKLINA